MRKCRTCGLEKEPAEFWPQSSRRDGLQSECKVCMRDRNNHWQRQNHKQRHASKMAGVVKSRQQDQKTAWLKGVRDRAKMKGLEYSLSPDDVVVPSHCPILGIPLASRIGLGRKKGDNLANSPSLDRIDNSRGYVPGNVVVISYRANRIKCDATLEELQKIVAFYHAKQSRRSNVGDRDQAALIQTGRASDDLPKVLSYAPQEVGSLSVGENR
jgi:hypothetical protein